MSEKAGVYNEGFGIKIGDYTKKDANGTETTVKNAISVDRNLGSNEITTKSKILSRQLVKIHSFLAAQEPMI